MILRFREAVTRSVSIEISALKNFTKFTGKLLCQSLFFNKVTGLKPATLLKKEALPQVFSWEFCEIFKSTIFIEHLCTSVSGFIEIVLSMSSWTEAFSGLSQTSQVERFSKTVDG